MVSVETLLYIVKHGKVLLIEKKRGLGEGLYNGVGGKVEGKETPEQAVIRECVEEVGVVPKNIEWMGVIEFYNDGSLYGYVHIFIADDYEGTLRESAEAKPVWFDIDDLPFDRMWEDDKFWLPLVLLKRRRIYARFDFVENWSRLVKKRIFVLKSVL